MIQNALNVQITDYILKMNFSSYLLILTIDSVILNILQEKSFNIKFILTLQLRKFILL